MTRYPIRLALILALLLVAGLGLLYLSSQYFDLAALKRNREAIVAAIAARPVIGIALFVLVFALIASVLPGAAIFKVASGAIFGVWLGVPIAVAATTLAATIGFVVARAAGRRRVEARFGPIVERINAGVEREGGLYLLAMRFNPLVPFFLINVGMGLTRMRLATFAGLTVIGVMPATFVYTNAGLQLAQIEHPSDIVSLPILASLVALSLLPIAGRFAALWIRRRAVAGEG